MKIANGEREAIMSSFRVVIDYADRRGLPLSPAIMVMSEPGLEEFLRSMFDEPGGLLNAACSVANVEIVPLRGPDDAGEETQQVMFR